MFHVIRLILIACALGAATARAAEPRMERLPDEFVGVGVEEKLGASVPMDLTFRNERGEAVRLGDYFTAGRPVVLNLVYYQCPMSCGLMIQGLLDAARRMPWTPGEEYEILTLSFDPSETPALASAKKGNVVASLGKPGAAAGWHFLTGDAEPIDRLTDAVGFDYKWIDELAQYSHPTAIMVLTPDGRVSRYLSGVHYDPHTLRLSLVEAADGAVGSAMDRATLFFCLQFDPSSGKYTLAAMKLMRAAGALTVVIVAGVLGAAFVREHRRRAAEGDAA